MLYFLSADLACTRPQTTSLAPGQDTDGDGIVNGVDKCPCLAEDKDNFEDLDGCPDADNDKDRLLDQCDLCPNQPETWNGLLDNDGCPDKSHQVAYTGRDMTFGPFALATASGALSPAALQAADEAVHALLHGSCFMPFVEVTEEGGTARLENLVRHINERLTSRGITYLAVSADDKPAVAAQIRLKGCTYEVEKKCQELPATPNDYCTARPK